MLLGRGIFPESDLLFTFAFCAAFSTPDAEETAGRVEQPEFADEQFIIEDLQPVNSDVVVVVVLLSDDEDAWVFVSEVDGIELQDPSVEALASSCCLVVTPVDCEICCCC